MSRLYDHCVARGQLVLVLACPLGAAHLHMHVLACLYRLDDLVESYCVIILVSPLMNILASLMVLHGWFNLTAELTRFADREFYLVTETYY